MEVHAHTHTARKKWTHYFWEFLMLFLAVFCSFLAENWREHFIERQREEKFAGRLLSDLRKDSVFFQKIIQKLEKRQKIHARFLSIMTDTIKATDPQIIFGFMPLLGIYDPEFTTTTYNQMKTSGSLRYIHNDDLTAALQNYYEILLPRASSDAGELRKVFITYIVPYMTKHLRFQDLNRENDSLQHMNDKILDRSPQSDQELINIMGAYNAGFGSQLRLQKPAKQQMLELIGFIKKEYHLE